MNANWLKKMGLTAVVAILSVGTAQAIKDPDKVVGPDKCMECHKSEGKAWQKMHHFTTFNEMHKSAKGKEIAEKMGVKQIKKDPTCMGCHFTSDSSGEAIAGISCESCHGAAKNWVKVHNDFGGKDVKKEAEAPAHKAERIEKSAAAGMNRPENIYNVAQNCFQCHTVPNEKLVETGGHKAGSDIELVGWTQGEVRHNYLSGSNKPASAERKRVLYVAGRILDLEYGLRGVAEITAKNKYAVEMAKRTKRALGNVELIKKAISDPNLEKIFEAGSKAELKPNNKTAIMAAVETISSSAKALLSGKTGAEWAAVDSLIPGEVKGKAAP